jgi:SecD/SecF fusion protein
MNRKWQFLCIMAVMLLTVYNILPTLFFYSKSLQAPITKEQSENIALEIQKRVNHLEEETLDWLKSYCELISVSPKKVTLDLENPQWISVEFAKIEEADRLRKLLPRAGALIPFTPAALMVSVDDSNPKNVLVQRQIPIHLDEKLFSWNAKNDLNDRRIVADRAAEIIRTLVKEAPSAQSLQARLLQDPEFSFGDKNPAFSKLAIDFEKEIIQLFLQHPVSNDLLVKEVAKLKRQCNEKLQANEDRYEIPFHSIPNTSGSIVVHLDQLAEREIQSLISTLKTKWKPQHPDLQTLSIVDQASYERLPIDEKALSLVVYSPLTSSEGGNPSSLYISAFGLERILTSYQEHQESVLASALAQDIHALHKLLYHMGFARTPNGKEGVFQFEKLNFAAPILAATHEDFRILGSKRYAILDLSNYEQRARTINKIETNLHQELIQWKENFLSSKVSLDPKSRFDTPKPTHNVILNNFMLTFRKILRGDESKVIRWGLDLSGGKTVEIELRDSNQKVVEAESDIRQGISELRNRVNRLGLSEVSIRQIGQHVVLDFPGSQELAASELIKASTMVFHVVNEKFSPQSPRIGEVVNRFLQNVWDEAVFSGKTDAQSVNEIARKQLASSSEDAKTLKENGLKFLKETDQLSDYSLDDTLSRVVVSRGSSPLEWHATHPLLITFNNYTLLGSDLENIHTSYDPSKGNFLTFSIAGPAQKHIQEWTSRFSKESILGTPNETFSHGRGWRMAVVLNDTVISSPNLESTLKDHASISGNFSQSDVQKLCSDLKAGSLTFTPHILSEKNVSPELGSKDRDQGILATVVALVLVIGCMIAYYRFAGLVASIAVIFNLLILWAVLQNLGATLTLAGIAGIILTVGMSIDANVLVFERIKEEFALNGRIGSAIQTGYSKAFSAIVDSNITTIIAALILLNFDAGPTKSFAMNLIIGITSSMFTALFMTRFYFTKWALNPKHTYLKMANWMRKTSFDFLKKTKLAYATVAFVIISGIGLLFVQSSSILGLDFTGGYSLYIELEPKFADGQYAQRVREAFIKTGAESKDFVVQEMNPTNQLRIFFGQNMEQSGKPFYQLPLETEAEGPFAYHKNPRISWFVASLRDAGIAISSNTLSKIHTQWTSVSGQMSDTMKNQALFGFLLAFIGIFIYLAFRFVYPFAAAALVCLIHDVLITLAIMGIIAYFGVPIQIDLITIAALMTAVGYSLNDTIIIFDRIREEMRLMPRRSLRETVNHALNFTLSRTLITSGTTLLVLLALLVLGGSSIFGFALVMTIGVIFGTLSSWFIAAPLMLFFHKREEKNLVAEKV